MPRPNIKDKKVVKKSEKGEAPKKVEAPVEAPNSDFSGIVDAFVKKDMDAVNQLIHNKVVDLVRDKLKKQ